MTEIIKKQCCKNEHGQGMLTDCPNCNNNKYVNF